MGHSLAWIAVKGLSDIEVAKALRVNKTGKRTNSPSAMLLGRQLANGWYLILANRCDDRITNRRTLAQISRGCQVIACSIEEHVMFSSCALWTGGKQRWSVKHSGDRSTFDVMQSGRLPEEYSSLKQQLLEKQKSADGAKADVDYIFELPLRLAKHFVGFKHDEEMPESSYEILEPGALERTTRAFERVRPWLYIAAFFIGVVMTTAFVGILFGGR